MLDEQNEQIKIEYENLQTKLFHLHEAIKLFITNQLKDIERKALDAFFDEQPLNKINNYP